MNPNLHILNMLNCPQDLKKLSLDERKELAQELRTEIIEDVSKTGGHLASNLGVVELTIALHKVFDTPKDKIVWDVGHQTYVHKILTGRREDMASLRQFEGLSGFPKTNESIYDVFNTGHSSTSISAALGIARARDVLKEDYHVIAVIGDGSLTGGMALEALNDAGASGANLIVVLNDNEMSIEHNTGGLACFLSKLRTKSFYTNSNRVIKKVCLKIPFIGEWIVRIVRRFKHALKQILLPNMYFEDIGFKYLGPVDGNDLETIESMLYRAKDLKGPVIVHTKTTKGKGYEPAEKNPDFYHGVGPFDINKGVDIFAVKKDYSAVFGHKLCELAKDNPKIIAITAAMTSGTGLTEFKNKYPDRFFDVEIAEQHAVTMAAGAATGGLVPVVAIYSSFMQRAFDQLIHDVCLQNLHVVMCLDRAGIVGADGETHQGMFDLAFNHMVPNLVMLAPKDFRELEVMLDVAINDMNGPVVIRYPRGKEDIAYDINYNLQKDRIINMKSEILKEGHDLSIIAIGKMTSYASKVSQELLNDNIDAEVINLSIMKPLDKDTIIKSLLKTKKLVTLEDGVLSGGLHSVLDDFIIENELKDIECLSFGYPDEFVKQGSVDQIEKKYGLDIDSIKNKIIDRWYKNA